jgi:hypothetical protein
LFLGFGDYALVLHISASRHQALQLIVSPQTGYQPPPPPIHPVIGETIGHAIGY